MEDGLCSLQKIKTGNLSVYIVYPTEDLSEYPGVMA